MEKSQIKFSRETVLKGFVFVLLVIITAIFLVPFLVPDKFCFASLDYATFVGGLAGPLASLVGFIYVYLTFLGQQEQLDEQRKRLDREDAFKEFTDFFNTWNEFRSNVKYSWNGKTGTQAFDSYWLNVRKAVRGDSNGKSHFWELGKEDNFVKSLIHHLQSSKFNSDGQYEDFVRMIYPLIEISGKKGLENKLKYLEGTLSKGEKAILIYSATFIDENQSTIMLLKSGFCDNIPDQYLITSDHRELIF